MYYNLICDELKLAKQILNLFIKNKQQIKFIENAAKLIANTFKTGNKILSCGNGGSYCDAMHFAEELTGKYRNKRIGYPAIAIADPGYITCVSNEFGYEYIFSRYVETLGNNGDVLFAISTSGCSINILNAIKSAYKKNMHIIALTGQQGGMITNNQDIEIRIPYFAQADRIQEMHIKIIHIIILLIEKYMNVD